MFSLLYNFNDIFSYFYFYYLYTVVYISQLSFVNNTSIKITYFPILNSHFILICDEKDIVIAKCQIFV